MWNGFPAFFPVFGALLVIYVCLRICKLFFFTQNLMHSSRRVLVNLLIKQRVQVAYKRFQLFFLFYVSLDYQKYHQMVVYFDLLFVLFFF